MPLKFNIENIKHFTVKYTCYIFIIYANNSLYDLFVL